MRTFLHPFVHIILILITVILTSTSSSFAQNFPTPPAGYWTSGNLVLIVGRELEDQFGFPSGKWRYGLATKTVSGELQPIHKGQFTDNPSPQPNEFNGNEPDNSDGTPGDSVTGQWELVTEGEHAGELKFSEQVGISPSGNPLMQITFFKLDNVSLAAQ